MFYAPRCDEQDLHVTLLLRSGYSDFPHGFEKRSQERRETTDKQLSQCSQLNDQI